MRSTQLMGLSPAATRFLDHGDVTYATEVGTRTYLDGRTETFTRVLTRPAVDTREADNACIIGMFGEQYPLHIHILPDGTVYREAVQREFWSSGPVIFLALQRTDGEWVRETFWTESEMRAQGDDFDMDDDEELENGEANEVELPTAASGERP